VEKDQSSENERCNVVSFAGYAARATQEPFLTNDERREIREMLAYYRTARPQFEAMKRGCPTARYLIGDE
jgi:hypothetical protein